MREAEPGAVNDCTRGAEDFEKKSGTRRAGGGRAGSQRGDGDGVSGGSGGRGRQSPGHGCLCLTQDDKGQVWAVYTDFDWIKRRHGIENRDDAFKMASSVIASITSSVAAK